jgi:hypothetical protein
MAVKIRILLVLLIVGGAFLLKLSPPQHRDTLALVGVGVLSVIGVWLLVDEVRLRRRFPGRDSREWEIDEAREREREASSWRFWRRTKTKR